MRKEKHSISIVPGIKQPIIIKEDAFYTLCPECGDGFGHEMHYFMASALSEENAYGGGQEIDSTSTPPPMEGYFSDRNSIDCTPL